MTTDRAARCPDGRVCTEDCGDRLCVYEYRKPENWIDRGRLARAATDEEVAVALADNASGAPPHSNPDLVQRILDRAWHLHQSGLLTYHNLCRAADEEAER